MGAGIGLGGRPGAHHVRTGHLRTGHLHTGTSAPVDPAPDGPGGPAPRGPGTTSPARPAGPPPAGSNRGESGGTRIIAWIRNLGPLGGGSGAKAETLFPAVSRTTSVTAGWTARRIWSDRTWTLYRGAFAACMAAGTGRPALARGAERALAAVGGRTKRWDCLDQAVYALLRDLVRMHREDPSATFRKVRGGTGQGPFSPRIRAIRPAHGPAAVATRSP